MTIITNVPALFYLIIFYFIINIIFPFCYIYMYRTLTNPKLFRSLAHSGFMFDDIICNFYCPLLNVIFHKNNPCINCFLQSMQRRRDVCLIKLPSKSSHSISPNLPFFSIFFPCFPVFLFPRSIISGCLKVIHWFHNLKNIHAFPDHINNILL